MSERFAAKNPLLRYAREILSFPGSCSGSEEPDLPPQLLLNLPYFIHYVAV
jgi:hypothetical protein